MIAIQLIAEAMSVLAMILVIISFLKYQLMAPKPHKNSWQQITQIKPSTHLTNH